MKDKEKEEIHSDRKQEKERYKLKTTELITQA